MIDTMLETAYSITARVYCQCGDAIHITARHLECQVSIREFWERHYGEGHGVATRRECMNARARRERARIKRIRETQAGEKD